MTNIGKDVCYQIMNNDLVTFKDNDVYIGAPEIGVIGEDLKVLRIDKMLNPAMGSNKPHLLFKESRVENGSNFWCIPEERDSYVESALPDSEEKLGAMFHEIGHLLRNHKIKKDEDMRLANAEATKKYKSMNPEDSTLSLHMLRQLRALEERGAWAMGLQILREVSKSIGLNSVDDEAQKKIAKHAQESLESYDYVDFNKSGITEDQVIPSFSSDKRLAAEKLRQEILASYGSKKYSDVPNFSQTTGHTVHNPEVIRAILFGDKEKQV
jgi:hypothetical protein